MFSNRKGAVNWNSNHSGRAIDCGTTAIPRGQLRARHPLLRPSRSSRAGQQGDPDGRPVVRAICSYSSRKADFPIAAWIMPLPVSPSAEVSVLISSIVPRRLGTGLPR